MRSVLSWAVDASGKSREEVALATQVEPSVFDDWLSGRAKPSLTQFRHLAKTLKRPTATFFLPAPPAPDEADVAFRTAPGANARALQPQERVRLREVRRLQKMVAWVQESLGREPVSLPPLRVGSDVDAAGLALRDHLDVTLTSQTKWISDSVAFHGWRDAIEKARISVFALPMGENAARGFSVWNDSAPLVAVNTHWNLAARIFTLLHELAHLATKTDSISRRLGNRP